MTTEFTVGSIRCHLLTDGTDAYPPEVVFANVDDSERSAALAGTLDQSGLVPSGYYPLLMETDSELVLLDAGLGEFAEAEGASAGKLCGALAELGVSPGDVTRVVVTHAHPDHIGGLTATRADRRVPVFGSATHYIGKTEWDVWTTGDVEAPEEYVEMARGALLPLEAAGLVEVVEGELEVAPGVHMMAAHGHTPGHTVLEIRSGGSTALCLGDAIVHELDVEHVGWLCAFDMDPAATVATRRLLLERAARDQSLVFAFHLALPGHVTRVDDRYVWTPVPT